MKLFRTICIASVPVLLLATYYFTGNMAKNDYYNHFALSGTLRNSSFVDPNPYAMFGSDAVVLMTEHELNVDHKLQITDEETGNLWEMDMQTGAVAVYDASRALIEERQLTSREVARWLTQDRFAEKYYSMSPYSYAAGNPIRYIDINGDSLDVAWFQSIDQAMGTNYTQALVDDLTSQTGLSYSISSSGILTYAVDNNGNAIIATDANGNQLGSATARSHMMNVIGHADMVTVQGGIRTGVLSGTNQLGVNITQMESLINGAVGVDNRTMGWGMTMMHELYHTNVGGGLADTPYGAGNPGPVERNMNIIRSELNAQGGNYGQRMEYEAIKFSPTGPAYVPFSTGAQRSIQNGYSPTRRQPHVRY